LGFKNQTVNTASATQQISLNNGGTTAMNIGAATGTNLGPTSEFRLTADSCSNTYLATGSCYVNLEFVPSAAGARTGTLSFPVTYTDGTTATLTANLTGTGVANTDRAVLTPLSTQFTATVIGQTSRNQTLTLSNSGTAPFVVGFLSGTNTAVGASPTGDFTTNDACSGAYIGAGGSCSVQLYFAPQAGAAGARTGSMTFPVTYLGATSPTNLTATYTGSAISTGTALQITPSSLQMGTWIQGTYSKQQTITLYNDGSAPVTFGNFGSAAPFFTTWNCGSTLAPGSSCTVTVLYQPSVVGAQSGTINLPNNVTGALQKVSVSGVGIAASQQLAFSQPTVSFGSQPEGTAGNTVTFSLINQSSQSVTVNSVNLGGTNPADFIFVSNGCNGVNLYGTNGSTYSSCSISVQFSPLANTASITPLTATITEFDSGTGSGRKATLTGTSTAPAAAVGLFPGSLSFGNVYEKTESNSQAFSVTNTGNSPLKITTVASSSTQFPITSNSCNGMTLAAGSQCLVAVAFQPSSTGSITGSITVTDNATGSPQTLPLSGTGVIPTASLSATALTFAQQGVGSTSASQSVTLSNTGSGTLLISSLTLGGADPGDYSLTNPCGSSVAAGAACTLSVTFTPKATGTRTATITIVDNSGLVSGASQTVTLTGTGIPVAATPTFSVASGTYASAQTVTLSDTTTGATIYYTTNGATPTTSSTKYTAAITVSANETIEAIAVATGYAQSAVATAAYQIDAATPTFSVASGTYASAQTVTLADTTNGATIYYTTNGTTPTTSSTKYTGAITVSANESIEAIAVATGYAQSAVSTARYIIQ
jgi:hypothetical protein